VLKEGREGSSSTPASFRKKDGFPVSSLLSSLRSDLSGFERRVESGCGRSCRSAGWKESSKRFSLKEMRRFQTNERAKSFPNADRKVDGILDVFIDSYPKRDMMRLKHKHSMITESRRTGEEGALRRWEKRARKFLERPSSTLSPSPPLPLFSCA